MEALKARRAWSNASQVLKNYDYQPRVIYPAKLSALYERGAKPFHDKIRLKNNIQQTNPKENTLNDFLGCGEE
jgi:hypothetical protein